MTEREPTTRPSVRRGSYAKGLAKREEILTRALEVVAREGYRGASVKEIAEAVGLTQAGLLHYFTSKEELFTEILRKRDERDALPFATDSEDITLDEFGQAFLGIIRHNADVPGLVELFSRLAVDATDVEHPARSYFLARSSRIREMVANAIRSEQQRGRIASHLDPETIARMLQAIADGMQLQWLLDRDVDMTAPISAVLDLLAPAAHPASP